MGREKMIIIFFLHLCILYYYYVCGTVGCRYEVTKTSIRNREKKLNSFVLNAHERDKKTKLYNVKFLVPPHEHITLLYFVQAII